ncbi:MAG: HAD-IA family hydrolase [Gammaproteobacteria bacterium]|nr:HAD-IA family hydrolase [Gammaproteobacteria bacterium]
MTPRLVLFDLDGTLADTAADIALVTNRVLAEAGRPPLSVAHVRARVSSGARHLLRSGFDSVPDEEELAKLQHRLFNYYAESPAVHTALFPGLAAVLAQLDTEHRLWGIVSNKPASLVAPIVASLALPSHPVCTIGGDSYARRKPDPLPLVQACSKAQVSPREAVYVGDARIDAEAARAAGMPLIVAGYGYAPERAEVCSWGEAGYAADAGELARLLGLPAGADRDAV